MCLGSAPITPGSPSGGSSEGSSQQYQSTVHSEGSSQQYQPTVHMSCPPRQHSSIGELYFYKTITGPM